MPVTRIDLDVPDLHRGVRLLGDLAGASAVHGGELAQGSEGLLLRRADGGASVALTPTAGGRARMRRLVLALPDIAAALTRLRAAGVPHTAGPDEVVLPAAGLGVDLRLTDGGAAPAPPPPGSATGAAGAVAFDHVCLAVPSLADSVGLLRDLLGGAVVFGGANQVLGTRSSQVTFGPGTRVELLQPQRPDSAIASFLTRRGAGLHHLTWHVTDVAAAESAALALGFEVVDTDLTSRRHWRETYVRPSSAMGLLVQMAWTDQHHDDPLDDDAVAAILDGRVDSYDFTMRPA